MYRQTEYAVIDVETTGFSPAKHDRIVEIGVVRVDCRGKVLGEYETLVNPGRDIGPSHIHGIHADDVREAPEFGQVVGDVQELMHDAVLVAHNASFDMRFLCHECIRCGAPLPGVMALCTLRLAKSFGPDLPSRNLPVLCGHYGIQLTHGHCAIADARATAALLAALLQELGSPRARVPLDSLGAQRIASEVSAWAPVRPSGQRFSRSDSRKNRRKSAGRLSRLFSSLPAHNSTHNAADEYLAVLERALEDREITENEIDALRDIARSLDMDQEEVREAHGLFLRDLVRSAWQDGMISPAEQRDIELVATLLGFTHRHYAGMVDEVTSQSPDPATKKPVPSPGISGCRVYFTGTFTTLIDGERVTREKLESVAAERGMQVCNAVTKSLDLLVCADANSMSTKARNARKYGVRIVAEPVFFKMIGM